MLLSLRKKNPNLAFFSKASSKGFELLTNSSSSGSGSSSTSWPGLPAEMWRGVLLCKFRRCSWRIFLGTFPHKNNCPCAPCRSSSVFLFCVFLWEISWEIWRGILRDRLKKFGEIIGAFFVRKFVAPKKTIRVKIRSADAPP